jgi:UrcA family protein
MNHVTRFALLGVLVGALNAAMATIAAADEVRQSVVRYSDLDLGHGAGAAVLYSRITAAAASVCGVGDSRQLADIAVVKRCRKQAISQAIADVDAPTLTSYYLAKSGKTTILARSQQ